MKLALTAATAAIALLVGSAEPSHASLMLKVSDGSTTQTLTDAANTGAVSFIGSIGAFVYNVVTGISTPLIGSIDFPALDLSFVDISSHSGGGTLTLALTDTGFLGGGGIDGITHFLSAIGGTINGGGSVSVDAYMDCGNSAFGTSTHLASQSYGGIPYSGAKDAYVSTCSGPYSVTELVSLTLPGNASISGDASLAVPEPATIALFGAGLLGLGFAMRRKAKATAI